MTIKGGIEMREILFRGKRKDNNEWVYGGIVHQTDFYGDKCDRWFIIDGTDTQDYDIGYEYEVISKTVSEWTGLYDKNNVRIFEGDIVGFDTQIYEGVETHEGIVYWCDGCFWIDCTEHEGEEGIYNLSEFLKICYLIVIGNYYDNKDFVK